MDRRTFLKTATLGSVGLTIPSLDTLAGAAPAAPDLAVAQGPSPEKLVRSAVDALGGIKRFIAKGDVVVVKPNIGWDRVPEQAGNTNPEVVATVVKLCFEAGAKKVKVFDRPVNDPRRCYVQSGIEPAAKAAGADVFFMDDRKFKETPIHGLVLKTWPLYTDVFEADTVINIPIAKHHGLGKLTLAMKNWMGIMGGSRRVIHQNLDTSLVDLAMKVKPALTIIDAVRILTANGPQGGDLKDVKKLDTIIAGVDQVATDAYSATLFGMQGKDLGYVRIAAENKFGVMDLGKLNIKKISV